MAYTHPQYPPPHVLSWRQGPAGNNLHGYVANTIRANQSQAAGLHRLPCIYPSYPGLPAAFTSVSRLASVVAVA
jgi:hypothetical protein